MKGIKILLVVFAISLISNFTYAVGVDYHVVTNDKDYECGGMFLPPAVDVFNAEIDYAAYFYVVLKGVKAGDKHYTKWYYENQIYKTTTESAFADNGTYCSYPELIIMGTEVAYKTGNWQVEYYFNGAVITGDNFYLQGIAQSSGGCAASAALDDDSDSLNALRKFRDETLSKTLVGQKAIALFYKSSPAIVEAMENNPMLKASARQFFKVCAAVINKFN